MEARQLTAWEAKERAGLLAIETEEWREKRLIAEAPDTTADVLEQLRRDAEAAWESHNSDAAEQTFLLLEALASHSNADPALLARGIESSSSARAFCRNPVVPFLLLEKPDFVADLSETAQNILLREASAPPLFIRLLATGGAAKTAEIAEDARLHITMGKVTTLRDAMNQIRGYWQVQASKPLGIQGAHWFNTFLDAGLMPEWAKAKAAYLIADPAPPAEYPLLDQWFRYEHETDSLEENALLRRIGPKVEDTEVLAKGLRADATAGDLKAILHTPGSDFGLVYAAILRHPSTDGDVIRELMGTQTNENYIPRHGRIVARHPKTPPDVLVHFLKNEAPRFPNLQRLALRHPNAPPNARAILRQALLDTARESNALPPLIAFIASTHFSGRKIRMARMEYVLYKTDSLSWTDRLEAAFYTEAVDTVLPGRNRFGFTGLDVLNHLARDGNRFVRWAAQTRLADPDFVFTWDEESN